MRASLIRSAIEHYREDVEHRAFPSDEESYHLPEAVRRAGCAALAEEGLMEILRTWRNCAPGRAQERNDGGNTIGLVPTMGALHAGHASLIRAAVNSCGFVAVSIFVNPTQFGPNEDFARYPRTFEADCALAEAEGADVVFAPSVEELYPAARDYVC
jgi:hypothetical protein